MKTTTTEKLENPESAEWKCACCGGDIEDDETNLCPACVAVAIARADRADADKRARRNAQRRDRDAVRREIGLMKVRGNLGGTYWE